MSPGLPVRNEGTPRASRQGRYIIFSRLLAARDPCPVIALTPETWRTFSCKMVRGNLQQEWNQHRRVPAVFGKVLVAAE